MYFVMIVKNVTGFFTAYSMQDDKILIEIASQGFIPEELLIQQSAFASKLRKEIDYDELVFGLSNCLRIIQGTIEPDGWICP